MGLIKDRADRRKLEKNLNENVQNASSTNNMSRVNNPYSMNKTSRDNYITYPYDYFSGINAKIFFGDVWVDDIITIQWSISQGKEPIYGYASQEFDAVAKGTRIVQGNLVIAFKEVGYLNAIDKYIKIQRDKIENIGTKGLSDLVKNKIDKASSGNLQYDPSLDRLMQENSYGSSAANLIRKTETIEDILINEKIGNTVFSGIFGGTSQHGSSDFEDIVEALEDTIWGDKNGWSYVSKNVIKTADEFDYNDKGGITTGKMSTGNYNYRDTLNITVTFGDITNFRAEHTVYSINDIHFTSQQIIVSPTGDPIAESYTFFSRDVNKSLGQYNINIEKTDGYKNLDILDNNDLKFLDNMNNNISTMTIQFNKGYTNDSWTDISIPAINLNNIVINSNDAPLDQLIDIINNNINNIMINDSSNAVGYSQLYITCALDNNNINFILSQRIPNTYTFEVIAPTRNKYESYEVFNREQLFTTSEELDRQRTEAAELINEQVQQIIQQQAIQTQSSAPILSGDVRIGTSISEEEEKRLSGFPEDLKTTYDFDYNLAESRNATVSNDELPKIRLRPSVKRSIENIQKEYGKFIENASDITGVSQDLITAMIMQESRGNDQVRSNAGAMGLMQLMPNTMNEMKTKFSNDYPGFDLNDPNQEQIMLGAYYLSTLEKDSRLIKYAEENKLPIENVALAAYNAGPGNVLDRNAIYDFKETKNYIPSINGYVGYLRYDRQETIKDLENETINIGNEIIKYQSELDKLSDKSPGVNVPTIQDIEKENLSNNSTSIPVQSNVDAPIVQSISKENAPKDDSDNIQSSSINRTGDEVEELSTLILKQSGNNTKINEATDYIQQVTQLGQEIFSDVDKITESIPTLVPKSFIEKEATKKTEEVIKDVKTDPSKAYAAIQLAKSMGVDLGTNLGPIDIDILKLNDDLLKERIQKITEYRAESHPNHFERLQIQKMDEVISASEKKIQEKTTELIFSSNITSQQRVYLTNLLGSNEFDQITNAVNLYNQSQNVRDIPTAVQLMSGVSSSRNNPYISRAITQLGFKTDEIKNAADLIGTEYNNFINIETTRQIPSYTNLQSINQFLDKLERKK